MVLSAVRYRGSGTREALLHDALDPESANIPSLMITTIPSVGGMLGVDTPST